MIEISDDMEQGTPAGFLCLRCKTFTPGGTHACGCHTKRPRFFGNGEYFGDGGGRRIYLGDSVADVMGQIESALQSALGDGSCAETIKIAIEEMTDAEIDALPEI